MDGPLLSYLVSCAQVNTEPFNTTTFEAWIEEDGIDEVLRWIKHNEFAVINAGVPPTSHNTLLLSSKSLRRTQPRALSTAGLTTTTTTTTSTPSRSSILKNNKNGKSPRSPYRCHRTSEEEEQLKRPLVVYRTDKQAAEDASLARARRTYLFSNLVLAGLLIFLSISLPLRFGWMHNQKEPLSVALLVLEALADAATVVALVMRGCAERAISTPALSCRERVFGYVTSTSSAIDIVALLPLQVFSVNNARYNRLLLLRHFPHAFNDAVKPVIRMGWAQSAIPLLVYIMFAWYIAVAAVMNLLSSDWAGTATWQKNRSGWDSYESVTHMIANSANIALNFVFASPNIAYPQTDAQIGTAISIHLFGIFVKSTVLALAASVIAQRGKTQEELRQKLDATTDEMQRMHLPSAFIEEVQLYYRRMWEVCKTFDTSQSDAIFDDLPPELRRRIEYEANVAFVRSIPMFSSAALDNEFVRQVARRLKLIIVMPGGIIFAEGEEGTEMFFLQRGEARVPGTELIFTAGSYFGETTLLFGGTRKFTVQAASICHMYLLTRDEFSELLDMRPDELRPLVEGALRIHNNTFNTALMTSNDKVDSPTAASSPLHSRRQSSSASFLLKKRSAVNTNISAVDDLVSLYQHNRRRQSKLSASGLSRESSGDFGDGKGSNTSRDTAASTLVEAFEYDEDVDEVVRRLAKRGSVVGMGGGGGGGIRVSAAVPPPSIKYSNVSEGVYLDDYVVPFAASDSEENTDTERAHDDGGDSMDDDDDDDDPRHEDWIYQRSPSLGGGGGSARKSVIGRKKKIRTTHYSTHH